MKASIECMIVIRKCELSKVSNKRVEKIHQKKILKIRYNKEDIEDKRNSKKKTNSFQIKIEWYTDVLILRDNIMGYLLVYFYIPSRGW